MSAFKILKVLDILQLYSPFIFLANQLNEIYYFVEKCIYIDNFDATMQ
jgi:hypothetical protein